MEQGCHIIKHTLNDKDAFLHNFTKRMENIDILSRGKEKEIIGMHLKMDSRGTCVHRPLKQHFFFF